MSDILKTIARKRQAAEAARDDAVAAIRSTLPDAARAIDAALAHADKAAVLRQELDALIIEHRDQPGVLAERRVNTSVRDDLGASPLPGLPSWAERLLGQLP